VEHYLVGLFNSIMFPSILPWASQSWDRLRGEGSGIMIMAIVGARYAGLVGVLADRIGIHHSFILPLICYFYIVYYGFKGSRPTRMA